MSLLQISTADTWVCLTQPPHPHTPFSLKKETYYMYPMHSMVQTHSKALTFEGEHPPPATPGHWSTIFKYLDHQNNSKIAHKMCLILIK